MAGLAPTPSNAAVDTPRNNLRLVSENRIYVSPKILRPLQEHCLDSNWHESEKNIALDKNSAPEAIKVAFDIIF
jgi:hypothetical protein